MDRPVYGVLEKGNFMGALPILPKNQKQRACLENEKLPANYMSDYSVMGLVVDQLDAALGILKKNKFGVNKQANGFEITFNGDGRMPEIVSLLQQNGIEYAMTDMVDQVYQG
jgi:hypothetical protein